MNIKIALISLALASVSCALAESGTLTFDSIPNNYDVNWNLGSINETSGSGEIFGRFIPSGGTSTPTFGYYCIDLLDGIWQGEQWSVNAVVANSEAGYLVDNYAPTDADHQAALQYAIWKAVTNGTDPLDITAGTFHVNGLSSTLITETDQYLADGAGHQANAVEFLRTGNAGQNQIVPLNPTTHPFAQTPSPAAALPFFAGLALKRRRAKTA